MAFFTGLISTVGNWAVLISSASIDNRTPGKIFPPRKVRSDRIAQTVVAVPKSATIKCRSGNNFMAPTASAIRSAPTSFGSRVSDLQAGFDPRSQYKRLNFKVFLRAGAKGIQKVRDHATNNDFENGCGVHIIFSQHTPEKYAQLVRTALQLGRPSKLA